MKKLAYLLIIPILALFACGQNTDLQSKGEMPVSINLGPAFAHNLNVTQVQVTITKGSSNQSMNLAITGATASGTFEDLEIGTYAIDVDVYDNLNLIATGSGTGTVLPGETTTVHITLHFVNGGLEVVVGWGLPYEECRRILLVGNSHTYFNDGVDTHLDSLVDAAHPEWNVTVGSQTMGGYTLENHYHNQSTLDAIELGGWDLVILQEQSSRPMTEPDLFYAYADSLHTLIAQAGSLTGFYMTWAWRNNPEMYEPVRDAYNYIGAYLDALVSPAGVAFHNALEDPNCPVLFAPDNYHPSLHGTYLAACTMLAEIWNLNPVGNSYYPEGISAGEAAFLQSIAWTTAQEAKQKALRPASRPETFRGWLWGGEFRN